MNHRIRDCFRRFVATIAIIFALYPSLVQGQWSFKSVRNFGAEGDGIHDDTGAIQAAIVADTVVYFPPGTYRYVGPMVLPEQKSYRLYGDGPGVSTILFTGNPNAGILAANRGLGTLNVDGLTLQANSYNCGTAIFASFDESGGKFRTATIHNVQIRGPTTDGTSGYYWSYGIHLYKAQNSVIDKVEISGNRKDCDHAPPNPTPCATPPTTAPSQIGILWTSSNDYATTGLQLSSLEIQHFNTALKTDGWVEGVYLTGFELTFCGQANVPTVPVVDLNATTSTGGRRPTFHLFNGHIQGYTAGLRARNISDFKMSKVHFGHNAAAPDTGIGNTLELDNCTDAIISKCSFLGDAGGLTSENGIVLNNSDNVRIAENYFSAIAPTESGCAIVVDSNCDLVRIINNVFGDFLGVVLRPYCDTSQNTYYRGNNTPP